MALLRPFRALRPAAAVAPAVASVPYDVVSTEEARELARGNPLSFLHVTRSEIDLPNDIDPYAPAVYQRARENLLSLTRQAPLVVEDTPSIYVYRLRMGEHEQTGVAAGFSLDEYESDGIKKHERTRRDKEDDRTRHIVELGAQTGVVFLTYRAAADVDGIVRRVTSTDPLYDFTAPDGVQHTVWRADAGQTTMLVEAFSDIRTLYIADGHHRAASGARARVELRARGDADGALDGLLAVAFPDTQVKIQAYNRTVKDLAGRAPDQFLAAIRERWSVTKGHGVPRRKGEVSMYLAGKWYAIDIGTAAPEDASRASTLDVSLLQRHVLADLLGIHDVRTDKRIDFVGGARGTAALEAAVDSGKAAVAFSLFPVTVDDLMAIADTGGIMPPKSTWFEPKLRDGLLIHRIRA
jgi:uncharacterized protein (DUF1015 family)